eukprot:3858246-Rhodomonas_salina.3
MPGTEVAEGASWLRARYAMSGTDLAYGATSGWGPCGPQAETGPAPRRSAPVSSGVAAISGGNAAENGRETAIVGGDWLKSCQLWARR